jgi:hypothetical protein
MTTIAQSQSLDTNADGKILVTAIRYRFDSLQTYSPDFGLVDAEQWLNAYWNVVDQTLCELNERRGAEERVSLKLLVEQLCELWERETGRRVTAHGMNKLEYTQTTETEAGRFVSAAVEALLPQSSWFDEHSEFSHSARAKTFLPSRQADRARHILVIMKDFVNRRSRSQMAFNSVNAIPAPRPVPVQGDERRCPPLPPPRSEVGRRGKLSAAPCGRVED